MTDCPNCGEKGEYVRDNPLTSVFLCRNDDCRVCDFDNVSLNEARENDE